MTIECFLTELPAAPILSLLQQEPLPFVSPHRVPPDNTVVLHPCGICLPFPGSLSRADLNNHKFVPHTVLSFIIVTRYPVSEMFFFHLFIPHGYLRFLIFPCYLF